MNQVTRRMHRLGLEENYDANFPNVEGKSANSLSRSEIGSVMVGVYNILGSEKKKNPRGAKNGVIIGFWWEAESLR